MTATAGSGGSISPSGATTVASGGSQSYSITPSSGYHVADVLVDGASVGAVSTHTITGVTVPRTISASFAVNPSYTISASAGAGGSISPAGSVSVTGGLYKTFTITAASGYRVANVVVDGVSLGTRTSYTFTNVGAGHTISASFDSL